jgi:hypothetical protein
MTTETKNKTERQVMKKQRSSMVSWQAMYLLAGVMGLGYAANAQDYGGITTKGVAGAGVPARNVFMILNGQDSVSLSAPLLSVWRPP